MKNNQAITLVALIITIIVLLILAGVTLSIILGDNGLINKAQSSVDKYQEASQNEELIFNGYIEQIEKQMEMQINLERVTFGIKANIFVPYADTDFSKSKAAVTNHRNA